MSPVTAVVAEAEALHRAVRRAIARGEPTDDEAYAVLARSLAEFQARHLAGYARLLSARGLDVTHAEIALLPAVPTDAFRVARVATYPSSLDVATFRTSGTTGALSSRGEHPMRTLATYHDAAIHWAKCTLFAPYQNGMNIHSVLPGAPPAELDAVPSAPTAPTAPSAPAILAISPTPDALPDSSLTRMLGWFVDELGAKGSTFVPPDDLPRAEAMLRALAADGRPVVVLATAFAWVHLLDRLGDAVVALPAGSRAMQTGGFKGRSREVSPAALRAGIARGLAIEEREVIGEYGMTELTSQLYAVPDDDQRHERHARHARRSNAGGEAWIYRAPPWVRVRACDPATLLPLGCGVRGIARIEDLGNVESAWAIQTADEVIVHRDGGVELLGRLAGAVPRGCSLAVEELIEGRSGTTASEASPDATSETLVMKESAS